jgi:two-component system, chemotaxis family, protein-glutamate methylesterase/glutaminase
MNDKVIKVLIIDDSALVREVLSSILSKDKNIKVVGSAVDPLNAVKKINTLKPDVLTLDLEMPRMDGLTFLEKLMVLFPMPVVIISTLARRGGPATFKALELGAVDFVTKPGTGFAKGLEELSSDIIAKVKNAAAANMDVIKKHAGIHRVEQQSSPKKNILFKEASPESKVPLVSSTDKIIAIGASTGGTVAVKEILQKLPANIPPILIALHMPAGFTASYAESLNNTCRLRVKEAEDGETPLKGRAYVAPGGKHMLLEKNSSGYRIKIENSPPVNRHRPSIDKTFFAAAYSSSPNSLGVILTGMGDDGARGIKEMYDRGSPTIAQDEKSSVVFGMPKQAIARGAITKVLPLDEIGGAIINFCA